MLEVNKSFAFCAGCRYLARWLDDTIFLYFTGSASPASNAFRHVVARA